MSLRTHPAVLATFLFAAMGADAEGCSAELEDDGESENWEFAPIPESVGDAKPMTCEFVEQDNCWKQLVADVAACIPDATAAFNDDRNACDYADGSRIEWDGSVNVPDSGTHIPFIEHRFLDAGGEPCLTTKFLGIAHVAFDVGGEVTVLQADSLTTFQLVCPDGATYRNDVEGSCPDLGARWLAHELPGYDVVCEAESSSCDFLVNGSGIAEQPRSTVASCGF